jgi:hypothetical protein
LLLKLKVWGVAMVPHFLLLKKNTMPDINIDNICLQCFEPSTEDILYANGYLCHDCAKMYIEGDLLHKGAASSEVAFQETKSKDNDQL